MRILTAAVLAVTLTVAGSLAAPSYADPTPSLPDQASDQAVEALETAQEALEGEGNVDPTLALTELQQVAEDLPKAERAEARALFARPNDPLDDPSGADGDTGATWEDGVPESNSCTNWPTLTQTVCVHYVPPGTGSFHTTGHAWAAETARYMQAVWNREVGSSGYRAPLSDAAKPTNNGGDGRLDVYLSDVGEYGYYGYAVPEQGTTKSYAYLVLDNDFAPWQFFGADPYVSLKATAAHEFFHAVQFAYDVDEDLWFMESTATWMEEQTFDEVNDNRFFINSSSLRYPHFPLDGGGGAAYGNWVYFQFLSEWLGKPVVKRMWERAELANRTSLWAIEDALAERGQGFAAVFGTWSGRNNDPATAYSEGRFFPRPVLTGSWSLRGNAGTGTRSLRLNHLASRNYRFIPASDGAWRLRVVVNGPTGDSTAYVLVHLRNGKVYRSPIPLNAVGNGSRFLDFRRSRIAAVTLNLGNGAKQANNRYYEFNVRSVR
jgi:hypothetical protein